MGADVWIDGISVEAEAVKVPGAEYPLWIACGGQRHFWMVGEPSDDNWEDISESLYSELLKEASE